MRSEKASLARKTVVFLSAVLGTVISAVADSASFMGGARVLMYFTIQSNLALALLSLIGIFRQLRDRGYGYVWHVVRLAGAVSITLTGVVFCFVLAPTMGGDAWNVQNVLTHVVVPVVSVLDYLYDFAGINPIKKKHIPWVLLPPVLYVCYAAVGYVRGWQFAEHQNYPYFFLNWGSPAGVLGFSRELPFMGVLWWIILLCGFLLAVAFGYRKLASRMKKSS